MSIKKSLQLKFSIKWWACWTHIKYRIKIITGCQNLWSIDSNIKHQYYKKYYFELIYLHLDLFERFIPFHLHPIYSNIFSIPGNIPRIVFRSKIKGLRITEILGTSLKHFGYNLRLYSHGKRQFSCLRKPAKASQLFLYTTKGDMKL